MYSKIYQKIIFPLMETYQGTHIQKNLEFLKKSQWWSKEEIETYQNKKLRALVKHSYENVPYYKTLFDENNIRPEDIKNKEDLQKIPYLTKDIIRKNLPDLTAKNIPKSQVMARHSSGSTGEPLNYYTSKEAYSWGWAQTFRCWSWAGFNLGDPFVKLMIHRRVSIIKKLQDFLMRCTYISTLEIERDPDNQVKKIKEHGNDQIIRGYSSWLYLLAKETKRKKEIAIKPKAIMTTGEPLYPHFRKTIETQFNCKIFDGYGGEEIPVAFECEKHDGYHLCEETTITEFVKDNKPVASGELGDIVLTNLNNYATPFIRYKINDMGIPSNEKCSCGRCLPLIKSIAGRDTDIVSTPDGKYIIGMFFVALFEDIASIKHFQVIQETIENLTIKIVKENTFSEQDLDYIKKSLKKTVGEKVNFDIQFVDEIPLAASGKRRVVISKIPPKFN